MDRGQPRDTRRWFSRRMTTDPDFPSGTCRPHARRERAAACSSTATAAASSRRPRPPTGLQLKPFFCTAFPMTIEQGVLTLDDREHRSRPECCASKRDGRLTVFDVCRPELRHTLGAAGLASLRRTATVPSSARPRRRR